MPSAPCSRSWTPVSRPSASRKRPAARKACALAASGATCPKSPQGLRFGGLWRDLPEKPPIQVVDNRGEVRPELSSAWRIRHCFNRKAKGTPVLEDFPWDGDTRPRGMPVEGTGQRPRYSRAYLRRPKTQHDRRLGFPLFEDGEPEFRGARRPRDLPTLWDDLPRRSRKDRSWKNFRATQWRQKG